MTDDRKTGLSVALGSFDGLHTGHMLVINKCIEIAKEKCLITAVMLFDRHPMLSLKGYAPPALLTHGECERMLRKSGVTPLKVEFERIKELSGEEFVKQILVEKLGARAVCCGFNYRFAKDGEGTADTLVRLCKDYDVDVSVVGAQSFDGEAVSSTRIRTALMQGRTRDANCMLGRVFSYTLPVIQGDRRGRTMGFPTANQQLPEGFIVPKYGVYASQTEADGALYPSVTNIGIRPTVGGNRLLSETHILGYSGNLYGREICVGLLEYMRGEIGFDSFDELSRQIQRDSLTAENIWKTR